MEPTDAQEPMNGVTYIYGLIDPRTDLLRYVGKSNDPSLRYYRHLSDKSSTHKACWIKGLLKSGAAPRLIILDTVPAAEWQVYERDWIECFRSSLTNITEGGIGAEVTAETRLKQR